MRWKKNESICCIIGWHFHFHILKIFNMNSNRRIGQVALCIAYFLFALNHNVLWLNPIQGSSLNNQLSWGLLLLAMSSRGEPSISSCGQREMGWCLTPQRLMILYIIKLYWRHRNSPHILTKSLWLHIVHGSTLFQWCLICKHMWFLFAIG